MARVFLGNPPWSKPRLYGVRAGSRWPHMEHEGAEYLPFPFYLGYSTALLEKKGHTCLAVDSIGERSGEDDFVRRSVEFRPDLIVLECSTASFSVDLAMASRLHESLPDVPIAFAGMHVDMYRPEFLDEGPVSFVLRGEYEYTLLDLANRLGDEAGYPEIPGLNFRDSGGRGVSNPGRESIENLDFLTWPARDHFPMQNYYDCPGRIPMPSLQVWASRGCPFRCHYCAWPQIMYGNNRYRTRSPADVAEEIRYCAGKYGMKSFYFDDDTFNIGKERMLALMEEIRGRDISLPWGAMCRADTSDEETFRAFRKGGMAAIKFGVECADQSMLDACGKRLDLEKVWASVRICQSLGIKIHLTFTFGFPGETWDSIHKTIKLARRLNPESVQFSILTPFPGSRFYEMLVKEGRISKQDWSSFEGATTAVYGTDDLTPEDLERAVCMAYRRWEWHKIRRVLLQPKYLKKVFLNPMRGIRHIRHIFRSYRYS